MACARQTLHLHMLRRKEPCSEGPGTGECDGPKRRKPPWARRIPGIPITRFTVTPITTSTANRSPAGAKRSGVRIVSRGDRHGSTVGASFAWMLLSGRVGRRCGRAGRGWRLRGPDPRSMTRQPRSSRSTSGRAPPQISKRARRPHGQGVEAGLCTIVPEPGTLRGGDIVNRRRAGYRAHRLLRFSSPND